MLENGFEYPEEKIYLNQTIVIEKDGILMVYQNWFQDFDREIIVKELREGGFSVLSVWSDLTGTPFRSESAWIGAVARTKFEL